MGTGSRGDLVDSICPSRSRLARIAEVLKDSQLESAAANDVFWDTVSSIENIGLRDVYTVTLFQACNFVGNGMSLRSS